MAIRRRLEKLVPQSLFSVIKWITAAKATGWSSTLLKKIECNISWVWLFLEKKKKKQPVYKKYGFSSAFQEFTYHKVKLAEREMCFVSEQFQAVLFLLSRFHKNWVRSKQWIWIYVLQIVTSYFCCLRLLAHFLILVLVITKRFSYKDGF